jgi:tetratricopeptide (TPR) repeat protein
MKMTMNTNEKRLSLSAIILVGIFCAVLILASVLVLRHIHIFFSPTMANTERLLERGRPREAKALLDRMQPDKKRGDSNALLLRGKTLFAVLMEELREERWGSYGLNPENWLDHPLAAEAERYFLDAMAVSPNNPEIRLTLGNLYREQGRFSDAEIILRSALEIDASNSGIFLALGLLYAEGGRNEAADRALKAAWELDEGNPRIAKNIAYFYRFYANAPEASIIWFSRYLDADPRHDPDINLIRAELRNLIERYPEFSAHKPEPHRSERGRGRNFNFRGR